MSFFKKLFGGGAKQKEKLILEDDDLGTFEALLTSGSTVTWQGTTEFMGASITILIEGDKDQLDNYQKKAILSMLNDEQKIEEEVNVALKYQYDNAEKMYSDWKDHFNSISISSSTQDLSLTMEEHESFYHFNIYFENNKAVGVSIDS